MQDLVSKVLEPFLDRSHPKPPPLRASTNNHYADEGNPLATQQRDGQIAINKTNSRKLSAVGPPSFAEVEGTVDEFGRPTERTTGQAV